MNKFTKDFLTGAFLVMFQIPLLTPAFEWLAPRVITPVLTHLGKHYGKYALGSALGGTVGWYAHKRFQDNDLNQYGVNLKQLQALDRGYKTHHIMNPSLSINDYNLDPQYQEGINDRVDYFFNWVNPKRAEGILDGGNMRSLANYSPTEKVRYDSQAARSWINYNNTGYWELANGKPLFEVQGTGVLTPAQQRIAMAKKFTNFYDDYNYLMDRADQFSQLYPNLPNPYADQVAIAKRLADVSTQLNERGHISNTERELFRLAMENANQSRLKYGGNFSLEPEFIKANGGQPIENNNNNKKNEITDEQRKNRRARLGIS